MSKTRNHSVRFDEDNFNFACKREGIKSGQKLVDFLLNEYCKLYRVEKQSVFSIEHPKVFDALPLPKNYFQDEPNQWQEPKKIKTAQQYVLEKRELDTEEDYIKWLEELENDPNLGSRQKQQIKVS